jgi:hypothetical protein
MVRRGIGPMAPFGVRGCRLGFFEEMVIWTWLLLIVVIWLMMVG